MGCSPYRCIHQGIPDKKRDTRDRFWEMENHMIENSPHQQTSMNVHVKHDVLKRKASTLNYMHEWENFHIIPPNIPKATVG